MKTDRIKSRLDECQRSILLTNCPERAERLRQEIAELKENLFHRRRRDRDYRDCHRLVQVTYGCCGARW